SSIDLSLLMSPVQYDSQQHGSVIVNGICSSIDLSALPTFAVASIYQRYRHSQQHRSVSVNGICSSIDLFISNILRSSSQQYRSIDVNGICSSTDLSANSILRSSIDLFADIMIRSSTYSSVALR